MPLKALADEFPQIKFYQTYIPGKETEFTCFKHAFQINLKMVDHDFTKIARFVLFTFMNHLNYDLRITPDHSYDFKAPIINFVYTSLEHEEDEDHGVLHADIDII